MKPARRPLVYFSYRLRGSSEHARRLAERLRQQNLVEVFADVDIPPGSHWPSVLQDGLERASAVIVLIDPEWLHYQDEWGRRRIDNSEDWVHREILHALNKIGKVLPVLVEDARMPPKQAMPQPLASLSEVQAARLRLETFERDSQVILDWIEELFQPRHRGASLGLARMRAAPVASRTRIERLLITGFRCFDNLELDFSTDSTLGGDWTCIAGLNGAGKSTILQAISLLFMGPDYARELGGERLQAMRRQDAAGDYEETVLRAWIDHGGEEHYLELTIDGRGPRGTSRVGNGGGSENPLSFWGSLDHLPVAGFGASRNLSDSPDRWDGASGIVLSQISLFDPMARLVRAEELLQQKTAARPLFCQLAEEVFAEEAIKVQDDGAALRFTTGGSTVRAHELPDGFRSSAAWMASLCARFSAARPSAESLEDLSGVALIDEIDLHLHASLQRKIVPRLRQALPKVQFIVTSHSPLVIASFDRRELVLLDRGATGGRRHLDRQIFAFSSDEIYNWLMDTSPHSAALDQKLEEGDDPDLPVLLFQTPELNEEQARERHARQQAILREMGIEDGTTV